MTDKSYKPCCFWITTQVCWCIKSSPVQPAVAAAAAAVVSVLWRAAVSAAPSPSSVSSWPPAAGSPHNLEVDRTPDWGPLQKPRPQQGEEEGWRRVLGTFPPHLVPANRGRGTQLDGLLSNELITYKSSMLEFIWCTACRQSDKRTDTTLLYI